MTSSDPAELARFLYRSIAVDGLEPAEVADIVMAAQRRNAQMMLTGCLHFESGMFFQWLEGPRGSLSEVIDLIGRDPRHRSMVTLDEGPLAQRYFANWNMCYAAVSDRSIVDWLAESGATTLRARTYADAVTRFLIDLADEAA